MNVLSLILSFTVLVFFGMGIFKSEPAEGGESITFSLKKEIEEGYGHSICFRENGDFMACNWGLIHLFKKGKLKASTRINSFHAGEPSVSGDGKTCYPGLNKVDLQAEKTEYLDLKDQFETGLNTETVGSPHPGHFEVRYSAWSKNGRDLAVFINFRNPRGIGVTTDYSGPDTRLLLLDGQSLKVRHVLRHDAGWSDRQVVSFSDKHVASAANAIRIWDIESGELLHEISTESDYCPSLCFDPSGKYLAAGRVGGSIEVFEVSSGKRVFFRSDLHSDRPMALAFHPDGNWLFSGGEDEMIFATDWKNSDKASVKLSVGDRVEGIAFSPYNKNEMYVSAKFRKERILIYEVSID